jgi:trehalose 6-phosphate phosphatase
MCRHLFESLHEMGDRVAAAPHVLLCLNFDGVLTPLADHPDDVELPEDNRRVLRSLAQLDAVTVAVFSGRGFSDLQKRVGVPAALCAANHGLEIGGPSVYFVEPTAAMFRDCVKELAADLAARLQGVPGALVEDKGLTVSVHYGGVPGGQRDGVRRCVQFALANANHPFLLSAGNLVLDIKPRVSWTKGNAVAWLRHHLGEAGLLTIYIGDFTDEDVFAALRDEVTVEVSNAPAAAAAFYLEGPAEVHAFLEWLFNRVREKTLAAGSVRRR